MIIELVLQQDFCFLDQPYMDQKDSFFDEYSCLM